MTRPVPEGRQEGEGEHDAAELGEDAGRRDHDLAKQAVRVAADHRPGEQCPEDRARDCGRHRELDRPHEGLDEDVVREQRVTFSSVNWPSDVVSAPNATISVGTIRNSPT